ncbi:unannotated protein [freshwater metagenome]|uniref:Unannotated protein n=1 Tax=freshwater metagenome TaxID=449393 RepID=A0A6J7AMK5_9ZZZZ
MIKMNGSNRLTQLSNQLLEGSLYETPTLWVSNRSFSLCSGKLSRTVVVNFVPSFNSPAIEFEPLVTVNLTTSSCSTAVTNSV